MGSDGDGMETDAAGRLYVTDGEHNAVHRRLPDRAWETMVHDPRLLWPDTMSVAAGGYLYVTANQLHRGEKYRGGKDERRRPYALFRTRSTPAQSNCPDRTTHGPPGHPFQPSRNASSSALTTSGRSSSSSASCSSCATSTDAAR